jgi:hypothetical protein
MKKFSSHALFMGGSIACLLLLTLAIFAFFMTTTEGLTDKPKKTFTVPQFQQGPLDGPVNSNTSSGQTNSNFVTAATNAKGDCFATNTCE